MDIIFKSDGVYIDFNRNEWHYDRYWYNPRYDAKTLTTLYYNETLKENRIKRMLSKIDSNEFKIKKAIQEGTTQIHYLNYIINKIKFKYRTLNLSKEIKDKIDNVLVSISLEIEFYDDYHRQLINYYEKIPQLKKRYLSKIKVLRNKCICANCFSEENTQKLIEIKRCKKLCPPCYEKDKELKECPICFEEFKKINMMEIKCGNNHFTCKKCYSNLKKMSNSCPICRGTL